MIEAGDQLVCSSAAIQDLERLLGLEVSEDIPTSAVCLTSMTMTLPESTRYSMNSSGSSSQTESAGSEDSFGLP